MRLLSLRQPAKLDEADKINQDPALQFIMSELAALRAEIRNSRNINWSNISHIDNARKRYMDYQRLFRDMIKEREPSLSYDLLNELKREQNRCATMFNKTDNEGFRELTDLYSNLLQQLESVIGDIRKS